MIPRAVLAASILLSGSAALADTHFDRALPVSGQVDLYVSSNSGTVHITPGSDSQVHISAHLHPGWNKGGDVEDRMNRIAANPPIEQSGNTIKVGDARPELRDLFNNISIDYEITAPRSVALNLRTGSGDINVDNVGRFLKAETGSGSVRAHGIAGPAELHTGSGDIELQQAGAGDVKVSTGSGSIRVNGLSGGLLARTGSGDIEANGTLSGPANLQSGSGSIRLHIGHDARYSLDASTGSGSIRFSQGGQSHDAGEDHHHVFTSVNGGGPTLKASTGSGDIEIN